MTDKDDAVPFGEMYRELELMEGEYLILALQSHKTVHHLFSPNDIDTESSKLVLRIKFMITQILLEN